MAEITSREVEQYLLVKGFEYKKAGNQYNLVTGCPFCKDGKPNHFYISEEGLWDCKKCGNKGNLYQLKKELGDEVKNFTPSVVIRKKVDELKPKPKTPKIAFDRDYVTRCYERLFIENTKLADYLIKERKFPESTIQHFQLGWDGTHLIIPVFEKSRLVNIRKRRNPLIENEKEAKYISVSGTNVGMFNTDSIKPDSMPVFITEGEMDTISLWTASSGQYQVVTGTGGSSTFKSDWARRYFKGKRRIYLCYDNDIPGKVGAEKVAEALGPHRCRIIELPEQIKDLNDYFAQGFTIKDFNKLLATAKKPQAPGTDIIEPISSVLNRVKEQIETGGDLFSGIDTGYPDLDKIIKRMRCGDLVIVSGATSMGKTFFVQNIIHKIAGENVSVMFFSLEMTPEQVAERFIMLDSGVNTDKFSGGVLEVDKDELTQVEESITKLSSYPIYFYNGEGNITKDGLAQISKIAVDQFGCQVIVVDHLHYFAVTPEDTKEVSAIIRQAKIIARDNEIPLIMISHIRKLESDSKEPTINDLRNSSLIGQDADIVLMVHRSKPNDPDPNESGKTTIKVLKNRHGQIGVVYLKFDSMNCCFDSTSLRTDEPIQSQQIDIPESVSEKVPDPTRCGYKDDTFL